MFRLSGLLLLALDLERIFIYNVLIRLDSFFHAVFVRMVELLDRKGGGGKEEWGMHQTKFFSRTYWLPLNNLLDLNFMHIWITVQHSKGSYMTNSTGNNSRKTWFSNKKLKREEIINVSRIRSNHYNLAALKGYHGFPSLLLWRLQARHQSHPLFYCRLYI